MTWTLITGASNNLGANIATTLAKQGHNVLVHYNNSRANAEVVVNTCRSFGKRAELIQGDFSTQGGVSAFLERTTQDFPEIKVLINNVGNYLLGSALTTSVEQWEKIFQNNLFTPLALIQGLIPSIKKYQGAIINIGTSGIALKANQLNPAYTAAKTSLLLLTKSLAKELASSQVRVNMVSPGQLETSVVRFDNIPMGREASYQDVIQAILFLLHEDSRYITGQNIEVAGGLGL